MKSITWYIVLRISPEFPRLFYNGQKGSDFQATCGWNHRNDGQGGATLFCDYQSKPEFIIIDDTLSLSSCDW